MKVRDTHILFVPGRANVSDDHWLKRWEAKLPNTGWIADVETDAGKSVASIAQVKASISETPTPSVIVAHSAGVAVTRQAIEELGAETVAKKLKGVLFVAPPDLKRDEFKSAWASPFSAYPSTPMSVPSFVIASSNDPYSSQTSANELAADWGSLFLNAGESGHIDEGSGHGPWPEGLMVFAEFMKRL